MADLAITERLADTEMADRNTAFMQYILTHGKVGHAKNVTMGLIPRRVTQQSL